jgi:hypothetical protein
MGEPVYLGGGIAAPSRRFYWANISRIAMESTCSTSPAGRADISRTMHPFAPIIQQMKNDHQIRVKRWRRSMSGCAWQVRHDDGRVVRWIEAPHPRTPISLAIFLHEVGHHVIGFERYKRRCEEEYHVWAWAIEEMRRLGVDPNEKVLKRFELSMQYAVGKAMRRGMKNFPEQLLQFIPRAA